MRKLIKTDTYTLIIFDSTNESWAVDAAKQHEKSTQILVSLDGTQHKYFGSDRFLVANHQHSFRNHMMWEGLLSEEEQLQYILKRADAFHNTGKQMVIEEYVFQKDEPFYDYSK